MKKVFTGKKVYFPFDWHLFLAFCFFLCKVDFFLDVLKKKSFSLSYTNCTVRKREDG